MAILNRMNDAEKELFRIKSLITNNYGEFSDEKVQKYMDDNNAAFTEVGLDIVRDFKKHNDTKDDKSS